ncbi:MAG: sigma-70 family RNA polymerase sigma factor [Deltaproteobacteria bacterium]|nr:sigma-70 family RNA polymerase sigma factor [Deltaproteobacteria bacterium]
MHTTNLSPRKELSRNRKAKTLRATTEADASFEREALIYVSDLRSAALRYTHNAGDADDLVQETLLRAYAAWQSFRSGTNSRAWLLRILTNNFINQYRRHTKERRWRARDEPLVSLGRRRAAADPEGVLMERLLGDEVQEALAALSPEYRQVVILADLKGLSYREVADRLGCPMGTVMSRLHRGRRKLSLALESYAREQGILREAA